MQPAAWIHQLLRKQYSDYPKAKLPHEAWKYSLHCWCTCSKTLRWLQQETKETSPGKKSHSASEVFIQFLFHLKKCKSLQDFSPRGSTWMVLLLPGFWNNQKRISVWNITSNFLILLYLMLLTTTNFEKLKAIHQTFQAICLRLLDNSQAKIHNYF